MVVHRTRHHGKVCAWLENEMDLVMGCLIVWEELVYDQVVLQMEVVDHPGLHMAMQHPAVLLLEVVEGQV